MSDLIRIVPTMSSLEIVDVINEERKAEANGGEFTVLRHTHFLAKIEKHPGIDSAKFLAQYKDSTGRSLKCYQLPKREAELMVMSESLKVQTRVYDRLAEKEAAAALSIPDFNDGIAMAEAWIASEKEKRAQAARADEEAAKRKQLEHKVAELAPAAAALERIAVTDEAFCITDAAKHLQIGPHKLRDFLLQKGWIYARKGKGSFTAYQPQILAGNLIHKYGNYQDPETGERKQSAQVLVTSKGITKLAEMLGMPHQQQARLLQ